MPILSTSPTDHPSPQECKRDRYLGDVSTSSNDPDAIGRLEAGHATILRDQGRRPIYVTVSPHQPDWSEHPEFKYEGATEPTSPIDDHVERIDARLAGSLAEGHRIDEMLEDPPGEPEGPRRLRDSADVQDALHAAADFLGEDRSSDAVRALLLQRAGVVREVLREQQTFLQAAATFIAEMCNKDGRRESFDLEADIDLTPPG